MDQKTANKRLADALGGTERAMEQLRYKEPSTAGAKLLQRLLTALDRGGKVAMAGEEWILEFRPELRRRVRLANTMFVIRPYHYHGHWVFDDEDRNLRREPFVDETAAIFDILTASLERPEEGFSLQFSADPFPGAEVVLVRRKEEFGGWWYAVEGLGLEGWLGAPLHQYFQQAPERIYAQVGK